MYDLDVHKWTCALQRERPYVYLCCMHACEEIKHISCICVHPVNDSEIVIKICARIQLTTSDYSMVAMVTINNAWLTSIAIQTDM